jgi:hypothetical protein
MRSILVGICLALTVSGCGGDSEMSLSEYVDRLNTINGDALERYLEIIASPQGGVLVGEGAQFAEFTPRDLQVGLEQVIEIALDVKEAADAIEPPEQIADLHHRLFDDKFTFYEEALAARAGTAADWEELSESPEMEAYRAAMVEDKQACIDVQAELDETAERGVFADQPWIPGEMKEIVDAFLGCGSFPEHPEDLYRYPPGGAALDS